MRDERDYVPKDAGPGREVRNRPVIELSQLVHQFGGGGVVGIAGEYLFEERFGFRLAAEAEMRLSL
jgi:hypothetical protein